MFEYLWPYSLSHILLMQNILINLSNVTEESTGKIHNLINHQKLKKYQTLKILIYDCNCRITYGGGVLRPESL